MSGFYRNETFSVLMIKIENNLNVVNYMSRSEQKSNMNFKALYELGCMVMAKMIALSTR